MKDYYAILNIKPESTQEEIKAQYRKLSKLYHPDVNPSAGDKFAQINEAYEILGDAEKRKKYADDLRKEEQRKQQAARPQQRATMGGNTAPGGSAGPSAGFSYGGGKIDALVNQIKQQSYKEGYNHASNLLTVQINGLKSEISTLKSRLAQAENMQQAAGDMSMRIRQEAEARHRLESELSRLQDIHTQTLTELEQVKQDLDIANDTIIEMMEKRDPVDSKYSRYEDEDYENEEAGASYDSYDEEDAASEEYDDDEVVLSEEEKREQFQSELILAEDGDPVAQNKVGEYYLYGTGVEQDATAAFNWFNKSAEGLCSDGLLNLGICYMYGEGVKRNAGYAEYYIRKAAYYGNDNALEFCEEHNWSIEL